MNRIRRAPSQLSTRRLVAVLAVFGLAAIFAAPGLVAQVTSTDKNYTVNADFDLGVLFNVNHNTPDQLQLNAQLTTFPIMWIANAAEDTVSKIDTSKNQGPTPGCEVARYRTGFGPVGQSGFLSHPNNEYAGPAPSRTAVDSDGNVYVANRRFDGRQPEVVKILASGFKDRNNNGIMETSSDLNNDCLITPNEMLPMADVNNNGIIEDNEIQDERVDYITRFGSNNGLGRSLCIDVNSNLWGGEYNLQRYSKLSSTNGSLLAGPISVPGNSPYGCIVDGQGMLWGASLGGTLAVVNTNTNAFVNVLNHSAFGADYGIAVGQDAQGFTRVYQATYSGNSYIEFNTATNTFSVPAAVKVSALGVAVDSQGNIIVGAQGGGLAIKYRPDGSVIWQAAAAPGTSEIRGVVVDANDDIWLIHRPTDQISKLRGSDGAQLGTRPVGDGPYTYTDATGLQRFNTTQPTGRWSIIQDGSTNGTPWGTVSWNNEAQGSVPAGASIVAEARAADNQGSLGSQAFTPVSNGVPFGLSGRFIEVRATLTANSSGQSPVLSDIRIKSARLVCDIDSDGDIDRNDSNLIMAVRNTPAQPGDPRDVNNSGIIDVVDARYCTARCTRPNCVP